MIYHGYIRLSTYRPCDHISAPKHSHVCAQQPVAEYQANTAVGRGGGESVAEAPSPAARLGFGRCVLITLYLPGASRSNSFHVPMHTDIAMVLSKLDTLSFYVTLNSKLVCHKCRRTLFDGDSIRCHMRNRGVVNTIEKGRAVTSVYDLDDMSQLQISECHIQVYGSQGTRGLSLANPREGSLRCIQPVVLQVAHSLQKEGTIEAVVEVTDLGATLSLTLLFRDLPTVSDVVLAMALYYRSAHMSIIFQHDRTTRTLAMSSRLPLIEEGLICITMSEVPIKCSFCTSALNGSLSTLVHSSAFQRTHFISCPSTSCRGPAPQLRNAEGALCSWLKGVPPCVC